MQQTTRRSRRTRRGAALGLAAALGLGLGLGIGTGPVPSAHAAPAEVYLTAAQFPTASDPAQSSFPYWQSTLNLANGETFFLHSTSSRYIMDALFTDSARGAGDGKLAYCLEPSEYANLSDAAPITWEDGDYLGTFPIAGADYLRDVLGADANDNLAKMLGAVLANGFSETPTRAEMIQWRWDDPVQGQKLARWVATQILVWETTVGERNADFTYNPVPLGKDPVSAVAFSQGDPAYQPYKNMIRAEYDQIAAAVQAHLTMPSFLDPAEEKAYDLEWDGSRFSVTLDDTNGVSHQTDFNQTGGTGLSIDASASTSVTFSVGMDDLVVDPDGNVQDFFVTAAKSRSAVGTVAWGTRGDQRVGQAESTVPIEAKARFKVKVGTATLKKELAHHTFDDVVTSAGTTYPDGASWFEYTPVTGLGTDPVQTFDLVAGRDRGKVGTMTVTNNFDSTITVSYALKPGLSNDGTAHLALLNGVDELTSLAPEQQPYLMGGSSIRLSLNGLTKTRTVGTGDTAREVVEQVAPAITDVDNLVVFFRTDARGSINTAWADDDTPFYVKVTGPSYPDGRVFPFSVNASDKIVLAPGVYSIVEVADEHGSPLEDWKATYSADQVTVVVGENVSASITNTRITRNGSETPTPTPSTPTPSTSTTPTTKPTGGSLASTGTSGTGALLLTMVTLLGAGTVLLLARRRTAR